MQSMEQLIANQNDVLLTLAHRVSSTSAKDTNLVFSPLSLHVVLSLIAAGSSGSTRDELLSFLKANSTDDLNNLSSELISSVFADGSPSGGPKLIFANGVWVDQSLPLKPSFKKIVEGSYNAASNQVDFLNNGFQVASEVNSWAERQTGGLIKVLLPPESVDERTKLILANALYFKGAWNQKFDASETKPGDFHLLNGGSVQVPFMSSTEEQFIRTFHDFKVLHLPYKQGTDNHHQYSMYIFLPSLTGGLPALEEKISSQPGFIDEHLPYKTVEVGNFRLPKFKISFGFEATEALISLGVTQPFSEGGLTEMVTESSVARKLAVSKIFQKTFVEVNEEGTEAAAVTAAMFVLMCYTPPVHFVADHPFVFLIREDKTGVVLFIGHVMNPSES